eukprot:TRINITY_DN9543_c0_g1_i1.p1 TRINITY_DN9543_c0_g1~~TRINITY_DN9543_c0_g1_i1.p1  ORF type:complete len:175 (-),score=36.90 TRINITY_DN9543_c0_g1_i1:119-643(-)
MRAALIALLVVCAAAFVKTKHFIIETIDTDDEDEDDVMDSQDSGNGNRGMRNVGTGGRLSPKRCVEEPKLVGTCKKWVPKWTFTTNSGCEKFIWGGCGGTRNKFGTLKACKRICKPKTPRECLEAPGVVGPCRGGFKMWTFYGGFLAVIDSSMVAVREPETSFNSLEACRQRCL